MISILDFIFPRRCVGCGVFGRLICSDCFSELQPTLNNTCPFCFFPSPLGKTHERCGDKTHLNGAISLVRYKGTVRKIIQETKYALAHKTIEELLMQLPSHWFRQAVFLKNTYPDAILTPIPLHYKRFNLRGFNQADVIAKRFKSVLNLHTEALLTRIKNTYPQALLKTKQQRKENILGAFSYRGKTKPQTVFLVDDLYTSASTANEAAKTLKNHGVSRVFLITLAHG